MRLRLGEHFVARLFSRIAAAAACFGCLTAAPGRVAAQVAEGPRTDATITALDQLDAWLGPEASGDRWRTYLHTPELRAELAKGPDADPSVLGRSLQQFRSGANGLELAPFVAARDAITHALTSLRQGYGDDLARLAWSARADHTPITPAQMEALRAELRNHVKVLEAALARFGVAGGWREYLALGLLQPHLVEGYQPTSKSLADLDEVLRRFRSNQLGLERPEFTNVAEAIARYRGMATWELAGRGRDGRQVYEKFLTDLQRLLKRHRERPSVETIRQIARGAGMIASLGQSPEFVDALRQAYAQPNIFAEVSGNFVTRAPRRPIDRITPVRDCILGTSIFGTAHTLGAVHYVLEDSPDSVQMAIYLTGEAHSNTQGFHKPVRIHTTGYTNYSASTRATLSDATFVASPATAAADTHTRIHSIQKTGGQFAHRLVEKIAWKRAGQQKRQSELISASHTRERVRREFEETVARDLAAARLRYEEKVHLPLVRRGASRSIWS